MSKIFFSLFVSLVMLFQTFTSVKAEAVKTMDNVSLEMLNAKYWVNKLTDADQTIMSKDEINQFNQRITEKLPEVSFNLSNLPDSFSKEELSKIISTEIPESTSYVDDKKLSSSYWNSLVKETNKGGIKETNYVKYGIVIKRTNMKVLPTEDIVSDDPTDPSFDQLQNTAVLVNEPIVILHNSLNGKWIYGYIQNCWGWVLKSDIAICKDKQTWLNNQQFESFIVVTGNKIRLDKNPFSKETSELELSMGTILELAKEEELPNSFDGRTLYDTYIVKIPTKDKMGMLKYKFEHIAISQDVNVGFLEYTRANILKQAFKMNGDRYGWGGMLNSRDCSSFIIDIYRSFGFKFPRNSESQAKLPCKTQDFTGVGIEDKARMLDNLLPGATLHFPGHVMMYLGKDNGNYYVISALGTIAKFPESSSKANIIKTRTVIVNDLSVKRASGKSWFEALTTGKQIEKN